MDFQIRRREVHGLGYGLFENLKHGQRTVALEIREVCVVHKFRVIDLAS